MRRRLSQPAAKENPDLPHPFGSFSASMKGWAAFSPAVRVAGSSLLTKSSSVRLVPPRALEIRCPLGGLDRNFRSAAAFGEDAREPILRHRIAVQSRLTENDRRRLFVFGTPSPSEQRDAVIDLRVAVVGNRCQSEQPRRFLHILGDAAALL